MHRLFSIRLFLLSLFVYSCTATNQVAEVVQENSQSKTSIQLLFLGDQGHHQPAARADQIVQALGPEGFHFTYTEDVADLNADYLANFDGLVHYGNRNELSQEQETALLNFVASK